jgi:hypothetical protein
MRLKEAVELLTGQRGTPAVIEQTSVQGILRELKAQGSRAYELIQAGPGLARRVEGVETAVDDVSASGQVVISAEANPAGYKAYFGVYLKANADTTPGTERRAGMHLGLTNADGGVFALDVDKFILRDNASGNVGDPFTYSGGLFTLTGNVTVNGNLLINGSIATAAYGDLTVSNAKVAYSAISAASTVYNASNIASVSFFTRANARLLILAIWHGAAAQAAAVDSTLNIIVDSSIQHTIPSGFARDITANVSYGLPTTSAYIFQNGGSNHTYLLEAELIENSGSWFSVNGITIVVLEVSR